MQDFAAGKAAATGRGVPELTCSSYLKKIVSPQVGRIMKLTGILLLVACIHVSGHLSSRVDVFTAKNPFRQPPFLPATSRPSHQPCLPHFYNKGTKLENKMVNFMVQHKLKKGVLNFILPKN